MGIKSIVNLDIKTDAMKKELLSIDGWNFSFHTRETIRLQYKKAINDGKLTA